MGAEHCYIGQPICRSEDHRFLTGQGQYIASYCLQEDLRLVPPDDCKEWILRWRTISYIKSCSYVERNRWFQFSHDKEGCDVAQHCGLQASPAPWMMLCVLVCRRQALVPLLQPLTPFFDCHLLLLCEWGRACPRPVGIMAHKI